MPKAHIPGDMSRPPEAWAEHYCIIRGEWEEKKPLPILQFVFQSLEVEFLVQRVASPPHKGGEISGLSKVSCTSLSRWKTICQKSNAQDPEGFQVQKTSRFLFRLLSILSCSSWNMSMLIILPPSCVFGGFPFSSSSISLEGKAIELQ